MFMTAGNASLPRTTFPQSPRSGEQCYLSGFSMPVRAQVFYFNRDLHNDTPEVQYMLQALCTHVLDQPKLQRVMLFEMPLAVQEYFATFHEMR